MRLRQLEYFLAVAKVESLTQAAAELFVAQPSLSQQIAALEREIGEALFERLPRGVQLTPAGRAFLVEAQAAVEAVHRAREVVQAVAQGRQGEIRVATITSLAVGIVPNIASSWNRDRPEALIRLTEHGHPHKLEDAVRIGDADLGIGPIPVSQMGETHHLGAEEFVFVLREDDPLAQHNRIDPRDLSQRPWVLFEVSHGLSDLIQRLCSIWGFIPRAAMYTSQTEAAVRLAAAGLGPTIVPANVISIHHPGVVVRPIIKPVLRRLAVYCRGTMGPLELAFLDTVQKDSVIQSLSSAGNQVDAIFL